MLLSLALIVATMLATFVSIDDPLGLDRVLPSSVNVWADTGMAVGLALLLMSLLGLAYSTHEWRVSRLKWAPGPVTIIADGNDPDDAHAGEFLSRFRENLAAGLDATITVLRPAEVDRHPHDLPFWDRVASSRDDRLIGPISSLVHLFSWPRTAYVVSYRLRTRDDVERPVVVELQISTRPGDRPPELGVEESTSEDAAFAASNLVCAEILPRTRQWRTDTYREWNAADVDSVAFARFQEAQFLIAARRYDEALAVLTRNAREGVDNLQVRVALAEVQERIGLFLDALLTLRGTIDAADSRGGPGHTDRTGALRAHASFVGGLWRNRGRGLGRIRIRYAATLAAIEKTTAQWAETRAVGPDREVQREEVRSRLKSRLLRDYSELVAGGQGELSRLLDVTSGAEGGTDDHSYADERRALDRLFLDAAELEYRRLLRSSRIPYRWIGNKQIRPHEIRLRLLSISVRRQRLDLGRPNPQLLSGAASERTIDRIGPVLETAAFRPAALHRAVKRCLPRLWTTRASWRVHYAAASVFALAMQDVVGTPDSLRNPDVVPHSDADDEYARRAVFHLRKAVQGAPAVERQRLDEQILAVEPDFAALRGHADFRDFEGSYYFRDQRPPPRPQLVQRFEVSRYVGELVAAGSTRMEQIWSNRRDRLTADPGGLALRDWLGGEREVLARLAQVTENPRHSPTRLEFQRTISAASMESAGPLAVPFPAFGECRPEGETVEEVTLSEEGREQRLGSRLEIVGSVIAQISSAIAPWERFVEQAGPRDQFFVDELDRYMVDVKRLWHACADTIGDERVKPKAFTQHAGRVSRPATDWYVDLLTLLHHEARRLGDIDEGTGSIDSLREDFPEVFDLPASDAASWRALQSVRHRAYDVASRESAWSAFREQFSTSPLVLSELFDKSHWFGTPHRRYDLLDLVHVVDDLGKAIEARDSREARDRIHAALSLKCEGGRVRARLQRLDELLRGADR